jgi:hypothetical protein
MNLTWINGRVRKDKRQICKKPGSGGLGALRETHNSVGQLQRVYYIKQKTKKWDSEPSRVTVLGVV